MKRRLQYLLVALASISFVPMAFPTPAVAAVADQRREVERVVDELDNLAEQANILAEDYNEALREQEDLGVEIEDAKKRVAEKSEEVDGLRSELAEVAVQAFTGSGSDVMGPLFSNAESYGDELRSDEYRSVALDVGSVSTDDLDEVVADLEDEKAALDSALDRQKELITTIAGQKKAVDERTAEYTQRRAEAEAKLGKLIQEEEQRRQEAAFAAAQAEAAAQARANSGGGGGGNSNSGGGGGGGGGNSNSGGGGGGNSGGATSGGGGGGNSGGGASSSGGSSGGSSSSSSSGGGGGGGAAPSVSGQAGTAVASARSQLGVPYKYATSSPGVSFDCSGLTSWAWATAGVGIPRVSRDQAASLPRVSPGNAQAGDLVFYYSPVSHVGIYIGGGQMIHAPYTGSTVSVTSVNWGKVTAVGRPG